MPQWWQIILNVSAPIQCINMNGKNGGAGGDEYEIYQTKDWKQRYRIILAIMTAYSFSMEAKLRGVNSL